jgi:hypothetical protein
MGLHPAMSAKVHRDAGGEQAERDGECADDPFEVDAALEHEEIKGTSTAASAKKLEQRREVMTSKPKNREETGAGFERSVAWETR